MSEKAKTKEEKFLIALYYRSIEDSKNIFFNRYEISQKLGFHNKSCDTICQLLTQTNFIKKSGSTDISITEHGINLAKNLIEDSN